MSKKTVLAVSAYILLTSIVSSSEAQVQSENSINGRSTSCNLLLSNNRKAMNRFAISKESKKVLERKGYTLFNRGNIEQVAGSAVMYLRYAQAPGTYRAITIKFAEVHSPEEIVFTELGFSKTTIESTYDGLSYFKHGFDELIERLPRCER